MAHRWSVEDMIELGARHARLEAEGDLDGTMATLVADPVYELWPIGLRLRGRAAVRRYYEHLIGTFMPSQRGYRLVEEWSSDRSLAQEYEIELESGGAPERHRVLGILWVAGDGPSMGGERIWGDERCLRAMLGPVWDELEPIEG